MITVMQKKHCNFAYVTLLITRLMIASMKKIIALLIVLFVLPGCTLFHPFMVWDAEQQSYVNSKWYEKQISLIKIEQTEDNHFKLSLTEEEARKAGVNRRIYKTFQHQVAQMNSIIDEKWKTPADTTGR